MGLARPGSHVDQDLARPGVDVHPIHNADHRRAGIPVGVDDARGQQGVGVEAQGAVGGGDVPVDNDAAAGLQGQGPAAASGHDQGAVEGDVIAGLKHQGGPRRQLGGQGRGLQGDRLADGAVVGQLAQAGQADEDGGVEIVGGEDVGAIGGSGPVVQWISGRDPQQAVGGGQGAGDAGGPRAPGHGARIHYRPIVPLRALDDIVAVGQGGDAGITDQIVRGGSDQAVGGGDGAGDPGGARAPGYGASIHDGPVAPHIAPDDIVAVGQGGDVTSDVVVRGRSDQAVGGGDGPGDPGGSGAPGCGARIHYRPIVPRSAPDDIVAVGQGGDATI